MLTDWMIQKTGMLVGFFMLSWTFHQLYLIYDREIAYTEAKEAVQLIAEQIETVANTAPEYSGRGFSTTINLPRNVHGMPYILSFNDVGILRITIPRRNISEFTVLPSAVLTPEGLPCFMLEGFNSRGEISVGEVLTNMNTTSTLKVSKVRDYCVKITALS
jgi:hypothetical protein